MVAELNGCVASEAVGGWIGEARVMWKRSGKIWLVASIRLEIRLVRECNGMLNLLTFFLGVY